eukprot:6440952-Amphidinium_carterae.2
MEQTRAQCQLIPRDSADASHQVKTKKTRIHHGYKINPPVLLAVLLYAVGMASNTRSVGSPNNNAVNQPKKRCRHIVQNVRDRQSPHTPVALRHYCEAAQGEHDDFELQAMF